MAIALLLAACFAGCSSSIEVYDEGTEIVTRKFGPSDLEKLGGRLMERLKTSTLEWTQGMPKVAIADFRNNTDKPGLNKQSFFDVIETEMFRMNKFDLIDHQNTKALLNEAGYQRHDAFDNSQAVEMGKALRAHYVMWGDISLSSDIDAKNRAVKRYRLSLKVTSVETHQIVYRDTEAALLKAVK
jgi:hypothetical protein